MDKYIEWLEKNKDTLLALYEAFQVETGDEETTLKSFCEYMYGQTTAGTATKKPYAPMRDPSVFSVERGLIPGKRFFRGNPFS